MTASMLLLVDYPGRRAEAHLSELRLQDAGYDCRSLLSSPLPTAGSAREYAGELCARIPDLHEAAAVLSYCAAAPLASEVAAEILAATGRAPLVVLFDPEECTVSDIADAYTSAVRQVQSGVTGSEGGPLVDVDAAAGRPHQLMSELAADLRERARLTLIANGYGVSEVGSSLEHVSNVYTQYLSYLVAMHSHRRLAMSGEILHVMSQSQPSGTSWLGVAEGQEIRIGCERAELARHPDTRRHILSFLEQGLTAPAIATGREVTR